METSTGEGITTHIVDNDDGTYIIYFVSPQEFEEISLSVFVNRNKIKMLVAFPFCAAVQNVTINPPPLTLIILINCTLIVVL